MNLKSYYFVILLSQLRIDLGFLESILVGSLVLIFFFVLLDLEAQTSQIRLVVHNWF